jgi:hypothetical protein
MKKEKRDDLALEIACRMGSIYSDNFGDSLIESAKFYKQMTGQDLGIKSLEETNNKLKGKKTLWQKIKSLTPRE